MKKLTIRTYAIAATTFLVGIFALAHQAHAYVPVYVYDPYSYSPTYTTYTPSTGVYNPYAYNYGYNTYPYSTAYSYNYGYNSYPYNYYGGTAYNGSLLQVTCYPIPASAHTGDTVQWRASAYGGSGNYSYVWSGSDNLSGSGAVTSYIYYSPGTKTASVTVLSGGQSASQVCGGSALIYDGVSQANNNSLTVACSPNVTSIPIGGSVTWNANAYGGNGVYAYSWTGTDGIASIAQNVIQSYTSPGQKYATVTITSNGQTVTQNCSSGVTVSNIQPTYMAGNYNYVSNQYAAVGNIPVLASNSNGLDIGCYADPASFKVDQATTWTAEVAGGVAPYTYAWTGSDGLSGTQSSVVKYYDTAGEKSAIVTVTSADGKTGSKTCTNGAIARAPSKTGTAVAKASVPAAVAQAQPAQASASAAVDKSNSSLTAASLFSLQNVPWGWVAVLIIIILFCTVMYLLFNRPKI